MKSRAQPHITGKYLFTIGQSGIRLFPVVSTTIDSKEREEKRAKLPIGIAGLDELLGGGIEEGSSLLLLGEPNSGRTLLSLQFLYTGAMDYKEPGIFFSFKRLPKLILEKFLVSLGM
jgi:circadian clock protein KaiC